MLVDNKTRKLKIEINYDKDRLEDELSSTKQKLANASVDKSTAQEKISDLEAILKGKDNELSSVTLDASKLRRPQYKGRGCRTRRNLAKR